jgi:hypothetical protein
MSHAKDWTTTWRNEFEAERGRQWMYDGTAREVAEAKGWRVIDARATEDMVLAERDQGELIAIGALPLARGFGFWSVAIER